jgi:Glycosyl transferase family 2
MRLVMTLVVRDEEDVIEPNLRYHLAQGVDFFVATDNGSTDGTVGVLDRYARAGLLHLIEERSDDYHELQAEWITRMARLAATDFAADWVINNDADEFWWPVSGTLADTFVAVDERWDALAAPRPEFVPRPDGPGSFAERMVIREARSHTTPKLAHRGMPDVNVFIGSHRLTRGGGGPSFDRMSRRAVRPVLRPVGAEPQDSDLLVPAPRWPIRILHFPLRSYAQYEARVRRIALQERSDLEGRRRELHDAYLTGRLPEVYAELVGGPALEAGLAAGRLVRDESFRDYLRACPDPLAADGGSERPPPRIPVRVPPDRKEAERAALEEDMMRALVRNEHTLLGQRARARRRFRECREELARRGGYGSESGPDRAGARSIWSRLQRAAARLGGRGPSAAAGGR